jgi:hypothetical protein
MNFRKTLLGLAAALLATAAVAQVTLPRVTSINSGSDLVQVVKAGSPVPGNVYASVSQLFGAASGSTTGLNGYTLPLTTFKNSTGTALASSAGAGVFGITISAGTSLKLLGEAANSNTKTDVAAIEVVLPSNYVAGSNITVTANTEYTLGSGTIGTHTLAAAAYDTAAAGTQASSLIATTAQTVPAAAGNVTFTITGATLSPGSRLWLTFTLAIQDSGGSNITGQINSVKLS